jgi:membrane associated rhomboid family serine protease
MAANIGVFAWEVSLGEAVDPFIGRFGLVPWNMTHGVTKHGFSLGMHVVPWFSSMFLHGGWLHIIGNMWFLKVFGDNVEDRLGKARFLLLYLSGGIMAGLAQVISAPEAAVPMVGASGAIAAVLGAYLVFCPGARVLTLFPIFVLFYFVQIPAAVFIGLWFVLQLLSGTAALSEQASGGVAWWAHIGGFVAGLVLAFVLGIGTVEPKWTAVKGGKVNVLGGLKRRAGP